MNAGDAPGSPSGRAAPPGPVPWPLGAALAQLYGALVAGRNRRYDGGHGVVTLDRPVISVGNLSVGGTGKTPMVAWCVRRLLDAGRRPCVALRGYRAGGEGVGGSDEAEEHRRALPGVPVAVGGNRVDALLRLFGTPEGTAVDCVVLDDGFQHRRLARQLDIVLIDATRGTLGDRLLPAGWLREPLTALRRAGHVVVTHAEAVGPGVVGGLRRGLAGLTAAPIAVARHEWAGLRVVEGGAERDEPVEWVGGRGVFAACAIGNPGAFLAGCGGAGARIAGSVVLRDHDPYAPRTVTRIVRGARSARAAAIVTTEKDWSKLRALPPETWPCAIVRPRLEMRFDEGEAELARAVVSAAERRPE